MAPASQLRKRAAENEMENLDESFVKIGTALPALSSRKTDMNEFLPVWQQEVKDDQGRRRLHGAFTGGFSAGYFNTVGSKEGWTPAEFKSSRSEKNKATQDHKTLSGSRPEDFMDAEDLAELESSKELKTKSQFDSITGEPHAPSAFSTPHYDPLAGHLDMSDPVASNQHIGPSRAGAALSDLIQPIASRVGHQLMQKMGWRHGQGIGPRITFERRRQLAQNFGIPIALADDEDDAERRKHLFPPPDRPLSIFQTRSGNAGLGYSKNHSLQLDPSFSQAGPSAESVAGVDIGGQTMPKGASFGLGALNDFEDEDHDIYDEGVNEISNDPRAQRLLVLEDVNTYNRPPISQSLQSSSHDRLVPPDRNSFTDGTRVLKGFRLPLAPPQSGTHSDDTWSSAPEVPDDWVPDPSKVWASLCPNSSEAGSNFSSRNLPRPLSASDRGRLLGEKQPPKSVFDFISAKEKARLEKVKQQISSLPLGESAAHMSSQAESAVIVPTLPPTIAQAALRGFMPFSHDLLKQQRYRLYLQSQAGMLSEGAIFSPQPKLGESVEQINKELEGFAKSAMMFKPMSAMMASRFISAASSTASGELATPQPGLRQPVFSEEQTVLPGVKSAADSSPSAKPQETLSEAAQAVRMDMFGMLTRITATFYPQKLLCKRFNVPNPFPQGEPTHAETKVPTNKMADFLTAHGFQPATSDILKANSSEGKHESDDWITRADADGPPKSLDQVGLGDDETQGRDILTTTRPAIDLFKAIFANDSEDDVDTEVEQKLTSAYTDTPMSTKKILSETAQNGGGSIHMSSPTHSTFTRPMSVSIPSLTPKIVDPDELGKLASFRPTFSRKADQSIDIMTDKDDSVRKQKKKSKKRNALVSFEDEDAEPIKDISKVKKKKSRQTMEATKSSHLKDKQIKAKADVADVQKKPSAGLDLGTADDLDDEWVEKPAALAVISNSDIGRSDPARPPQMEIEARPPTIEARGRRPRACDLMDD